jgi:hypothetical protein
MYPNVFLRARSRQLTKMQYFNTCLTPVGAMMYLVVAEMLPDCVEMGGKSVTAWGVLVGLCSMLFLTEMLDNMNLVYDR